MKHDLDYYHGLPYERIWEARAEERDRYFIVRLQDIPQVSGAGETKDEAVERLREAFDDYVTWRLEDGLEVVPPSRFYLTDKVALVSEDFEWTSSTPTTQDARDLVESVTERARVSYSGSGKR
jgi:predicted RNase H-like HicB family nuclease